MAMHYVWRYLTDADTVAPDSFDYAGSVPRPMVTVWVAGVTGGPAPVSDDGREAGVYEQTGQNGEEWLVEIIDHS